MMENHLCKDTVSLIPMTEELCHIYFRGFQHDEAIFMDMSNFAPYRYKKESVGAFFLRQTAPDRRYFAIMVEGQPIGELVLKRIDFESSCCTMGIHLQNDIVKGKGYGTRAERLALRYAFTELKLQTVYADTVRKNTRSRHVLEKVGFELIGADEMFFYFKMERENFMKDFQIRKCCMDDAAYLQKLNREEMGYDYSVEATVQKLQKLLQSEKDCILVAVSDKKVVGYVHACDYDLLFSPHMKNIMAIAVAEAYRRSGIGSALLQEIEKWAKETGAAGVRLVSGASRTEAHSFYQRCGYRKEKEQFNFKKRF